jgi:hypothetical protein
MRNIARAYAIPVEAVSYAAPVAQARKRPDRRPSRGIASLAGHDPIENVDFLGVSDANNLLSSSTVM